MKLIYLTCTLQLLGSKGITININTKEFNVIEYPTYVVITNK